MSDSIRFILDGVEVEAAPDETIWQVARRHDTHIPHLCTWLPVSLDCAQHDRRAQSANSSCLASSIRRRQIASVRTTPPHASHTLRQPQQGDCQA